MELGKKAEYKSQYPEAINHYMNAMYHLENDYKNLNSKREKNRLDHVLNLNSKVEELKNETIIIKH